MSIPLSTTLQNELPEFTHWHIEYSPDRIAWLGLDKQDGSTNVLSREVLTELERIIDLLHATPPSGLIIYSLKANGFISGADINEFPKIVSEGNVEEQLRRGHDLLARLEAGDKE